MTERSNIDAIADPSAFILSVVDGGVESKRTMAAYWLPRLADTILLPDGRTAVVTGTTHVVVEKGEGDLADALATLVTAEIPEQTDADQP